MLTGLRTCNFLRIDMSYFSIALVELKVYIYYLLWKCWEWVLKGK